MDVGESDPDPVCKYDGCKFLHTTEYLAMKEPDIGEYREIKMKNHSLYQCCGSRSRSVGAVSFFGLPDQDPDPDPDLYQNVTDPQHWLNFYAYSRYVLMGCFLGRCFRFDVKVQLVSLFF